MRGDEPVQLLKEDFWTKAFAGLGQLEHNSYLTTNGVERTSKTFDTEEKRKQRTVEKPQEKFKSKTEEARETAGEEIQAK